ncbi:MAG TPA: amidase [Acidimicrobiia bacterium]|jgi:amidase
MTDDLALLDATAQAELVRSGQLSPVELVDAAINRIEKLNPEVNAVIHPRFDQARDEAAAALPDGPFRGVPTLFKDLMCALEGEPYHEGMRFLKDNDYRPRYTDNLVHRFREAGFISCGRTNTPELGLVPTTEPAAYGPSLNPWDTSRTPGGSSGGSAAAVATGMVPVAHGTDGGGSIRIPASCCGLIGLKPSRGRTSLGPRWGQLSVILTCELVLARSTRDVAGALDALSKPFPGDPVVAPAPGRRFSDEVGADPGKLRIGILTSNPLGTGEVHPDCVAAAEDAGRLLESLGHQIEPSFPDAFADPEIFGPFTMLWTTDTAHYLDDFSNLVGKPVTEVDVEPLTWALAEAGRAVTGAQFREAIRVMEEVGRRAAPWWDGFDLLLTPTLGEPPLPLGTLDPQPDNPLHGYLRAAEFVPFTVQFNVSGQPAISVPLSWNDDGLPIGTQLVAAYGREDLLLRVAAQLEQARPWADRRPPVHA